MFDILLDFKAPHNVLVSVYKTSSLIVKFTRLSINVLTFFFQVSALFLRNFLLYGLVVTITVVNDESIGQLVCAFP